MTDALRDAAQNALDVLDEARTYTSSEAWSPSMTEECGRAIRLLRAALAAPPVAPVAWHCPRDPDSATAFFWRRPINGLCPNCSNPLVPVVLAAAPGAPDAQPNVAGNRLAEGKSG